MSDEFGRPDRNPPADAPTAARKQWLAPKVIISQFASTAIAGKRPADGTGVGHGGTRTTRMSWTSFNCEAGGFPNSLGRFGQSSWFFWIPIWHSPIAAQPCVAVRRRSASAA